MRDEVVEEAEKLTKRYGEIVAVDEGSSVVHRGEIFGMVGPNEAGKTTYFAFQQCHLNSISKRYGLHILGPTKICCSTTSYPDVLPNGLER